jgi:hypothetical protein
LAQIAQNCAVDFVTEDTPVSGRQLRRPLHKQTKAAIFISAWAIGA